MITDSLIVKADLLQHSGMIARLASQIWREHYGNLLSGRQIDYMLEKFQSEPAIMEQMERGGYTYYIIYANGGGEGRTAVGYMGVKFEDKKLFLSKFYILKSYRGKGLGRLGFDFLFDLSAEAELQSVWLTVNKGNLDSIAVYEHLGFVTVREQVADIGEGFVMDDYIMEKRLVPYE